MEMSDKYIIWLDSAIPLSGEKPPNRVNTKMEGFFPLYNIFEKKHVYPMQSMRWKGWKLKKRAEMKRGPHVLFLLFFLELGFFLVDIVRCNTKWNVYYIYGICVYPNSMVYRDMAKSEMDA